jgi:hypothetical protein
MSNGITVRRQIQMLSATKSARSSPTFNLFADILRLIAELRPPPDPEAE